MLGFLNITSAMKKYAAAAMALLAGALAQPTATGTGGAAATVDALATRAAMEILAQGGNAVDAAVAAAAVLGVTEPYSCGIGGGGFMVIYLAKERRVVTVDHREVAPAYFSPTVFNGPNGQPLPFAERVNSGLSVGVPGTVKGWEEALARYGTLSLGRVLQPAIRVAQQGFTVDATFVAQTQANLERFRYFTSTSALFLPGGAVPAVGSTFRNPDLARTTCCWPQGAAGPSTAGLSPRPSSTPSITPRWPPVLEPIFVRVG
jgi:gamma-glutamyltranspeptidase/glutathione hydrolase